MRHEMKYTLGFSDYITLKSRIARFFSMDMNSSPDGYTVTSLYFDNEYNSALKQKIEGEDKRHKFRIRFYNDDLSHLKLEKKSKTGAMTLKDSCLISKDELSSLLNGEFSFLKDSDHEIMRELYGEMRFNLLKPKVIVRYHRVAFTHPLGDTRITFDRGISTSNNIVDITKEDVIFIPVMDGNQSIMEIKFNGIFPSIIKSLIQTSGAMQSSASKYVYSRKFNFDF